MANKSCVVELGDLKLLKDEEWKDLESIRHKLDDDVNSGTITRDEARKMFDEKLEFFLEDSKYKSMGVLRDFQKQKQAAERIIVAGDFKKTVKNLINFFEGDSSIDTAYRANGTRFMNSLRNGLKNEGLLQEFYSGEFDEAIMRQSYNRANGLPDVADVNVVKMFEVIRKLNNEIYDAKRGAGLNIKYRRDYVVRRGYNAESLLKLGETEADSRLVFIDKMKNEYLDVEKSFFPDVVKNADRVDAVLGDMFDSILKTQNSSQIPELVGKKSYVTSLKSRKLEYKTPEMEYAALKDLGHKGTLGETMDLQMDQSAKVAANAMFLGIVPEKGFSVLKGLVDKNFRGTVDAADLNKALTKAHSAYLNVTAPQHTPATTADKAVNLMRGLQAFTKLGSSIFAAAWDLNSTSLQYAVHTGDSLTKSYAKTFVQFAKVTLNAGELRNLGEMLNVNTWFNDTALMLGGNRGDYDTGFDFINNAFHKASYLTGVPQQTMLSRGTGGVMMSKAFQQMIDAPELNNLQKLAMKEFNISDADLSFIRDNTTKNKQWGFISSKDIRDIDLNKFSDSSSKAMKLKEELLLKYNSYIDAAVQKGTPTPTAQTRRHLGKTAENPYRSLFSLVMQFKETAWKIGTGNKEALNRYYAAQGVKGTSLAIAEYMGMAGISYFALETLKAELFDQKTPAQRMSEGEDMRNMFFDFINKSSVAPLISDAVDQGTSPYRGASLAKYFAGPTLGGTVPDAFDIIRDKDTKKAAWKFARRNVLPSNWVPVKAGVRHMLEYDLITGEKLRK